MKTLSALLFWFGTLSLMAQGPQTFDITGTVRLINRPPEATPVDALDLRIQARSNGFVISAQPDREGKFVFRNVQGGRYSLLFPMPGRISVFAIGGRRLAPEDFELGTGDSGPLSIEVSLKVGTVVVNVRGLPGGGNDAIAMLVPADNLLTLRESCYSNHLSPPDTVFRFTPVGEYRVLAFNRRYSQDVAAYAPKVREFLSRESAPVEVSGENDATVSVSYAIDEKVEAAIREASGPFSQNSKTH
jgi:hypothetical protein